MSKFNESRAKQMALRASVIFPGLSKRRGGYSDEYYTPDRIPASLGVFDLDPCAGPKKYARRNIQLPNCGLSAKWKGRVWMNPPYSKVHEWLEKFADHGNGITLVNARPETRWFQRIAAQADAILWLRGRVEFERPDGSHAHSTVGSVLLACGAHNAEALRQSCLPGILTRVIFCENAPAPLRLEQNPE
jgi:hypothetical protein